VELVVAATSDGRRVQLDGDLDLAGVTGVRAAALAAIDDGEGPLILDLSGLGHLASAGMGLLLELVQHARRAGTPVSVVGPRGGPARRVLELTGLASVLAARG
jgi:anti-anti-sigma factor